MTNRSRRVRGEWAILAGLCLSPLRIDAQPAGNTQSALVERQFQAAIAAQDRGDLDQAQRMLLELHSKHPGTFAVDESLGLLYVNRQQYAAALPLLKAAAHESPSSAIAHANLGADCLKLGKSLDAVRELQVASTLDPNDRDTQANLAQALIAHGQSAEAAKAFGKAVAIDPGNSDLRSDWSSVLLDNGDTKQAAVALAPIPEQETMPRVQALLGEIAEKQGRFLDAVEHLQQAAKLDPSEANLYLLGIEYLKHWTFQPALQFFEYGVGKYPESHRLLLGLGITRYAMNQLAVAAPIFVKLLDAEPENTTYADLLGRSCTLMPDMIEECDKLEHFAAAHPGNAAMDTYAATSILARSSESPNLALAGRLLDEAIQIDPKLAEAHFQKAFLLQDQEEWLKSVPELEKAIALQPDYARAHYRLAVAYTHTGNKGKAQEQIALQKKYREQENDGVDARLHEVQIFLVNTLPK